MGKFKKVAIVFALSIGFASASTLAASSLIISPPHQSITDNSHKHLLADRGRDDKLPEPINHE